MTTMDSTPDVMASSVLPPTAVADTITTDRYIWIYCLPIIFLVGVCGNVLTVLVMRRKRMRGTATSVYLTLLAVADTSVLLIGIVPEWLYQTFLFKLAETHQWVCKAERFLFYCTSDVAIWILVAFTCDRFIAVCFPLKKREYCTTRRAQLACLIVFLLAIAKNVHVFWTRGAVYADGELVKNCGKPEPYAYFERQVRPWLVLALVSLGPFLVILVCNALIVKELFFSQRMRASAADRGKAFTQTTAMCLSTSFAFLVLITPSIVLLIGKPQWTKSPNAAYDIAKAINNQLTFLNHSINFFLYCLTGGRFREEFVNMFTDCGDNKKNGSYSMASSVAVTKTSSSAADKPQPPATPQFVSLRKSLKGAEKTHKVAPNEEGSDVTSESDQLCGETTT